MDLRKLILENKSAINKKNLQKIMFNTLAAIKFLHSCNIIHRDVKPGNIFLNKDLQVKIGDFGVSRTLPETLTGKGSCNSSRVRNFIRMHNNFDKYF